MGSKEPPIGGSWSLDVFLVCGEVGAFGGCPWQLDGSFPSQLCLLSCILIIIIIITRIK
jgi:hypothetical protein